MSRKAFIAFVIAISMVIMLVACVNNPDDKIPDSTTDAATESKASQTTDLDTSSNITSEKTTESKVETTEKEVSTEEISETVTESDPVEAESTEVVTGNDVTETESKETDNESSAETDRAHPIEPPAYPVPEESSEEDTISPTESISNETQIVTEETTEDVVETTEEITEETTEEEATTEKEITEETSSEINEQLTYEEFISMSPEDQQAYMFSYGTDAQGLAKFQAWYIEAKSQYDAEQVTAETGDGNIDIGDYIN